jgi:hypothetical protein
MSSLGLRAEALGAEGSGRLVDADYVSIELECSQCLLLGPAHSPDAHTESLRRGLQ